MTMRIRYLTFLFLVFLNACASTSPSNRNELKKLQGNWRLVYQQLDGDEVPNDHGARLFNGRMTIVGDKAVYAVDLPGYYFEFKYQVDATKEPHAIDLETLRVGYERSPQNDKYIGNKAFGIYRLNGDDLLICWNPQERPETFSAPAGTGNTLVVLKRK